MGTAVDDFVANAVIAQLLFLQMEDGKKDISIYIKSPGGSVTAGLAIYDTMQFMTCDINTYCVGMAASMGAVLLAAGTRGKRYALPNSDIMIHQVSGGAQGTASDVERTVEFMFKLKKRLIHILAQHTHNPETDEQVKADSDRDYYMSAEEAKAYGLVDEVVKSRKEMKIPEARDLTASVLSDTPIPDFILPFLWPARIISPCAASAAKATRTQTDPPAPKSLPSCDSCINVCKGILDKELNEDARKNSTTLRGTEADGNPPGNSISTSSARNARRRCSASPFTTTTSASSTTQSVSSAVASDGPAGRRGNREEQRAAHRPDRQRQDTSRPHPGQRSIDCLPFCIADATTLTEAGYCR